VTAEHAIAAMCGWQSGATSRWHPQTWAMCGRRRQTAVADVVVAVAAVDGTEVGVEAGAVAVAVAGEGDHLAVVAVAEVMVKRRVEVEVAATTFCWARRQSSTCYQRT